MKNRNSALLPVYSFQVENFIFIFFFKWIGNYNDVVADIVVQIIKRHCTPILNLLNLDFNLLGDLHSSRLSLPFRSATEEKDIGFRNAAFPRIIDIHKIMFYSIFSFYILTLYRRMPHSCIIYGRVAIFGPPL